MKQLLFLLLFPLFLNAQKIEAERWSAKSGPQFNAGTYVAGMTYGSYQDYAVDLAGGTYDVFIHAASMNNNAKLLIGTDTFYIGNTAGWDKYQDFHKKIILPASKSLRVTLVSYETINLDYLLLTVDFVIIPPMPDTIYCQAVMYRSGNSVLIRTVKYLSIKRDINDVATYYDDTKIKRDAMMYFIPAYGWLML